MDSQYLHLIVREGGGLLRDTLKMPIQEFEPKVQAGGRDRLYVRWAGFYSTIQQCVAQFIHGILWLACRLILCI